jgi:putative transposase
MCDKNGMPRTGRIVIPNCPHHVIHRGHNRNPVFIVDDDYRYYLKNLFEIKNELGCRIHAYCLMTNHVHLIVDPGECPDALAILIKKVAARQTRYVNRLEGRTGTIWEGRYRSSPVCKDTYLMACSRYVEMNPVKASVVADPSRYRWSSYDEKTVGPIQMIDPDPAFLSLGANAKARAASYQEWVLSSIPEGEWEKIHDSVQRGHLTGGDKFRQVVADRLGIRLDYNKPGRPRRG